MQQRYMMEYWLDDGWYVGRLRGVPGVFALGKTLDDLETNIQQTYRMAKAEVEPTMASKGREKEIVTEI